MRRKCQNRLNQGSGYLFRRAGGKRRASLLGAPDARRRVRRRTCPLGVELLWRVPVALMQLTSVQASPLQAYCVSSRSPSSTNSFITGGRRGYFGALTVFKQEGKKTRKKKKETDIYRRKKNQRRNQYYKYFACSFWRNSSICKENVRDLSLCSCMRSNQGEFLGLIDLQSPFANLLGYRMATSDSLCMNTPSYMETYTPLKKWKRIRYICHHLFCSRKLCHGNVIMASPVWSSYDIPRKLSLRRYG